MREPTEHRRKPLRFNAPLLAVNHLYARFNIAPVFRPLFGGILVQRDRLIPVAEHVQLRGRVKRVVGVRIIMNWAFNEFGTRTDE